MAMPASLTVLVPSGATGMWSPRGHWRDHPQPARGSRGAPDSSAPPAGWPDGPTGRIADWLDGGRLSRAQKPIEGLCGTSRYPWEEPLLPDAWFGHRSIGHGYPYREGGLNGAERGQYQVRAVSPRVGEMRAEGRDPPTIVPFARLHPAHASIPAANRLPPLLCGWIAWSSGSAVGEGKHPSPPVWPGLLLGLLLPRGILPRARMRRGSAIPDGWIGQGTIPRQEDCHEGNSCSALPGGRGGICHMAGGRDPSCVEPAGPGTVWHFTASHGSSQPIAGGTGAALHPFWAGPQPLPG